MGPRFEPLKYYFFVIHTGNSNSTVRPCNVDTIMLNVHLNAIFIRRAMLIDGLITLITLDEY